MKKLLLLLTLIALNSSLAFASSSSKAASDSKDKTESVELKKRCAQIDPQLYDDIYKLIKNKPINVNKKYGKALSPMLMCTIYLELPWLTRMVLQDQNLDIDATDNDGETALCVALNIGSKSTLIKALLDKNANPNHKAKHTGTPLYSASMRKSWRQNTSDFLQSVRYLLDANADINYKTTNTSPLLNAIALYNYPLAKLLIEKGATIDPIKTRVFLSKAEDYNNPPLTLPEKADLKAKILTLLNEAATSQASAGSAASPLVPPSIRATMSAFPNAGKADLDASKKDASRKVIITATLSSAATQTFSPSTILDTITDPHGRGTLVITKAYADAETDIEDTQAAFNEDAKASKESGQDLPPNYTKLMLACQRSDYKEVVELLADKEVRKNINEQDLCNRTALHLSIMNVKGELSNAKKAIIQLLLENGADPDIIDVDNTTPLSEALSKHWFAAADILIKHGADIEMPTKEPALNDAINKYDLDLVKYILKHKCRLLDQHGKHCIANAFTLLENMNLQAKNKADLIEITKLLLDTIHTKNTTKKNGLHIIDANIIRCLPLKIPQDQRTQTIQLTLPMLVACMQHEHKALMEHLLEQKCHRDSIPLRNKNNSDAINYAAINGYVELCKLCAPYHSTSEHVPSSAELTPTHTNRAPLTKKQQKKASASKMQQENTAAMDSHKQNQENAAALQEKARKKKEKKDLKRQQAEQLAKINGSAIVIAAMSPSSSAAAPAPAPSSDIPLPTPAPIEVVQPKTNIDVAEPTSAPLGIQNDQGLSEEEITKIKLANKAAKAKLKEENAQIKQRIETCKQDAQRYEIFVADTNKSLKNRLATAQILSTKYQQLIQDENACSKLWKQKQSALQKNIHLLELELKKSASANKKAKAAHQASTKQKGDSVKAQSSQQSKKSDSRSTVTVVLRAPKKRLATFAELAARTDNGAEMEEDLPNFSIRK